MSMSHIDPAEELLDAAAKVRQSLLYERRRILKSLDRIQKFHKYYELRGALRGVNLAIRAITRHVIKDE